MVVCHSLYLWSQQTTYRKILIFAWIEMRACNRMHSLWTIADTFSVCTVKSAKEMCFYNYSLYFIWQISNRCLFSTFSPKIIRLEDITSHEPYIKLYFHSSLIGFLPTINWMKLIPLFLCKIIATSCPYTYFFNSRSMSGFVWYFFKFICFNCRITYVLN